jgi:uncharacterized repeat protein (TIGR01451 family)
MDSKLRRTAALCVLALLLCPVVASGQDADLSVTKTDSPDPVVAGTNLTYTVTVSNAGPLAAAGAAASDTLPASWPATRPRR